eukprot:jgi/Bigna1/76453/fgenesh1_pg.41_\
MAPTVNEALVLAAALVIECVVGVSFDFEAKPFAEVRTDPILKQNGLSGHVHPFFGAPSADPDADWTKLREISKTTASIKENKSLHWVPAVCRKRGGKCDLVPREKIVLHMCCTCLIFTLSSRKTTGGGKACEQHVEVSEGCSNQPLASCEDDFFEMEMIFPHCWNGRDITSPNGRAHVSYGQGSRIQADHFDSCPRSHPIKLPLLWLFLGIQDCPGGNVVFADGTKYLHADFLSRWEENFLQQVIDNCRGGSPVTQPLVNRCTELTYQNPRMLPHDASHITTEATTNVACLPGNPKNLPNCSGSSASRPTKLPTPKPTKNANTSPGGNNLKRGLRKEIYQGFYYGQDGFFDVNKAKASKVVGRISFSRVASGSRSFQFTGFFDATTSGCHNFRLENRYGVSKLYFGNMSKPIKVNNRHRRKTAKVCNVEAGSRYPFRIQYGNRPGKQAFKFSYKIPKKSWTTQLKSNFKTSDR